MRYFLIAIFLLTCCHIPTAREKLVKQLTNDSSKYWNKIYHTKLIKKEKTIYPYFRYYFNSDGTWREEKFKNGSYVNTKYGTDIAYPDSWQLKNDSIIILRTLTFRIIHINEDTLVLVDWLSDTSIFRSSIGDTSYNNFVSTPADKFNVIKTQ